MAKSSRDSYLRRTYGISEAEYEAILKEQKGVCWICSKPPKKRRLHVDHEHVKRDKKADPKLKRTKVRGLLCWGCNTAIAKFGDDAEKLINAANYIDTWPAQQILKGDIDE
jgi:hypothetical protein